MINKSLVAAAIASLIAAGTAQAETLKVSTAAPNGTPWVKHLEKSAANLAEISGGARASCCRQLLDHSRGQRCS